MGRTCAYCGEFITQLSKEHVFPKCLYPKSRRRSRVQRLTVPACNQCNNSWSNDEAHFRNILSLISDPNEASRELWESTVQRSFQEIDGAKRMRDLILQMRPIETLDGPRQMIFPGMDERVMRVVRKAIRGLCHHHRLISPVLDHRVWADILKYQVPQDFVEEMEYHHREQDVVEYRYQVIEELGIHSGWLLTFFERVTFIGMVSMSKAGF